MRTPPAAVLLAFSAGAFAQSASSRSINIDRPGQLEALERENPGHYLKILQIREFASRMPCTDEFRRTLAVKFEAADAKCPFKSRPATLRSAGSCSRWTQRTTRPGCAWMSRDTVSFDRSSGNADQQRVVDRRLQLASLRIRRGKTRTLSDHADEAARSTDVRSRRVVLLLPQTFAAERSECGASTLQAPQRRAAVTTTVACCKALNALFGGMSLKEKISSF